MTINRFPHLSFHLQVGKFVPYELFCEGGGKWNGRRGDELFYSKTRARHSLPELPFERLDLLYVVGMGLGEAFDEVKGWLSGGARSRVIFWEGDLAVIDACVRGPWGKQLLECAQVHMHYAADFAGRKEEMLELACLFPTNRVEVVGGDEEFRLEVLQMHMMTGAYVKEALFGHQLFGHTLKNAEHLQRASFVNRWKGAFEGIPALVCGAGPSLALEMEAIRKIGERALVIAGGSAITALTRFGIEPHLNVAIDPNEQEVRCLTGMELKRAPLIFSHRLHPEVFSLVDGPLGYLKTEAGGKCERWIEKELGIGGEPLNLDEQALSVTTLSLALAVELGCRPIVLVGVDLAFTGGKRYPDGVIPCDEVSFEGLKGAAQSSEEVPVWKRGVNGYQVLTLVKWVSESESVSALAKRHPSVPFINATREGLGFSEIPKRRLEEVVQREFTREFDLRGQIERLLSSTPLQVTQQSVADVKRRVAKSVRRSLALCEQMLGELERAKTAHYLPTPKMALYESDLGEELIYELVLNDLGCVMRRLHGGGIKGLTETWRAYKEALEAVGG